MICSAENAENECFYVVTNDAGFNILSIFWKKRHINVKIISDLTGKMITPLLTPQPKQSDLSDSYNDDDIRKKLKSVINKNEEIAEVIGIITKSKTKKQINHELTLKFKDGKKVSKIHKVIKQFIKNLPA